MLIDELKLENSVTITNKESIFDLIYILKVTLAYMNIAGLDINQAFELALAIHENGARKDGYSPKEAVLEDISYWSD